MTVERLKSVWVNGARGWTMFCFGLSATVFGLAFFGPIKIIPPSPKGLVPLNEIWPLEWWGAAWLVVAVWLFVGAFRQDQALALGAYAFMLFVSASSFVVAGINEYVVTGFTTMWYSAAFFVTILGACLGVARLVNAPPLDVDALLKKEGLTREELGDDT